jgi:hypothetical protein
VGGHFYTDMPELDIEYNTLIERKSRMRQVRGVRGEAVVSYRESLTTNEMAYHRLSRRVNKMKIRSIFYNSSICLLIPMDLNRRFLLKCICLSSFLHFVYDRLR